MIESRLLSREWSWRTAHLIKTEFCIAITHIQRNCLLAKPSSTLTNENRDQAIGDVKKLKLDQLDIERKEKGNAESGEKQRK